MNIIVLLYNCVIMTMKIKKMNKINCLKVLLYIINNEFCNRSQI